MNHNRLSGSALILPFLLLAVFDLSAQGGSRSGMHSLRADKQALIFSTVKGTDSRPDTLRLYGSKTDEKIKIRIAGEKATDFKWVSSIPTRIAGNKKIRLALIFSPPADFTGVAKATLQIRDASGKMMREIDLSGLSLNGLERANEPPLATVLDALGYGVNPGWDGLKHTLLPDMEGDEVLAGSFRKAGKGVVDIEAVARFSPDYELPFGYCTYSELGPDPHQVGVLAKTTTTPQHQTLFPEMASGGHSFDPGEATFGFYTSSPTHTVYTADDWNLLLNPGKAGHATRVYPAKDQKGHLLANTYILCFEEAQNGDYQDYVFVVRNVRPLTEQEQYAALLNGKDLDGWDIFLNKIGLNNDQEHNFSVEDGAVHVRGKDLGYIRTKKSFSNYHFKVEFKWGEKKWPPREGAKRDGGVCYNIPDNEPDSIWPKSIECQIQEGDVGDFWLLSFSTIEVDGMTNHPSNHTRIIKKKDGEKPNGEWNTVEIISYNGRCIQIVNGLVVNDGDHASIKNGRILLQSEYSEIYYRNARIRKLTN